MAASRELDRAARLRRALAINLVIVAVQVAAGLAGRSLGLLADAGHNLTDVGAVLLALIAARLSARPPTATRSFGFHRSTVLAAQANAWGVLGITGVIGYEAVRRLLHPVPVHGAIVIVVAVGAFVANLAAALAVRDRSDDLNMRSAFVHLAGDAAASLGVAAAGAIMLLSGGMYWLDPAVSLAIGVLIGFQATKLLREVTDVLLEGTPGGLDMDEVSRTMAGVAGVDEVHDLHAWSLSGEVRALSAHLVMAGHPTLEEAQAIADTVKARIRVPFGIAHATLELECETCVAPGSQPCEFDGIDAAPGRGHTH